MAPSPSRWAQLLVVCAAVLATASTAQALTGATTSPATGTWFAGRTVSVAGTASGPAIDSTAFNATYGFSNASGDGASLQNGSEVHLVPTGLTNWRFFEAFNYPLGTQAANISDSFHHSFLSGAGRNWSVTDALSSRMPGAPALGASEDIGNFSNELYWHATVPRPIAGVNVSFRFGTDGGARLQFHSSVTGLRNNFTTHMDSLFDTVDPSSASYDLGARFDGRNTVFLRFTYTRGSNGSEWAAIDDLQVDISFAPQAGPQPVSFNESFAFGGVNPALDGLWWTAGGGWSASNALLHLTGPASFEEARFAFASRIVGANLSFNLGCQNIGPTDRYIRAEAGPSASGPWTLLAETNSTAADITFDSDVAALAGNQSLFFRATAQNRCYLTTFRLTVLAEGDPPEQPRGALIGDPVDLVRPVDWVGASYNATLPAGTRGNFWLRWSDNGIAWSRWVRAADGPLVPFETSRFVQPMVTLSASGWSALPVLYNFSVRFSGITEVSVSVDQGATWDPMIIGYAPNASVVTWAGTVVLEPGANDVRARAVDTTGSLATWNVTLGWDTLAPPAPRVVDLPPPFTSSGDLTWSWDPPLDTGLGVEAYAVRVGSLAGGGDLIPLLEVGGNTSYTLIGGLDGHSYFFSVRAKDRAGNWGPWGNASHGTTVDATPPGTTTVPAPSPFVNESSVSWSWPPAPDNGSGVASYEVRVGTSNGSDDVVTGLNVNSSSYTLTGAVHGRRYYIAVRAADRAGNVGAWGPGSAPVAVDLVAPSPPGPPEGPVGFWNITQATWNWSEAQDYLSGVASYEVQVGTSRGGGDLFAGPVSARTLHLTGLPDGAQIYARVRARDLAGNFGPWVESAAPLQTDRSAPAAPAGLSGPTGWINQTTATWVWTGATDAVSGLSYHEVRVGTFSGGADLLHDYRVPGESFAFQALVEDTPIYFSVRGVDHAGNPGPWSTAAPVQVDMAPPTAPGAVTSAPSPSATDRLEWSWAPSSDSGSGVAYYLVRVGTAAATGDVVDWARVDEEKFAIDHVQSGRSYYFSVRAIDAVGWGSRDRPAETAVLVDTEPPAPPEVWPAAPATREPQADVFWSLVPDPGGSGLERFEVAFGPRGGAETTAELSPYQFVFELDGADGELLALRVRAVDRAGNVGDWSARVDVRFDRSPPSPPGAPTASLDGQRVSWAWSASQDAGVGDVTYVVTIGTAPGASDVVARALTNETSYSITGQPGTTYFLSVSAVDGLGNEAGQAVGADPVSLPAVAPIEVAAAAFAIALGSLGILIAWRRRGARRGGPATEHVEEE